MNIAAEPVGCWVVARRERLKNFFLLGMLAIPVLRNSVATVLDWCSQILIFTLEMSSPGEGQELFLPHLEADQRLQVLKKRGVTTLICGALSEELFQIARQLRLDIICGVAGEIAEVLQSYWQNRLNQPRFRLPCCRGPRRHRGRRPGHSGS